MWQLYARLAFDIMDERVRQADARNRPGRSGYKPRAHPGSAPRLRLGRAATRIADR
ncbi:MAG: hypothetical protein M3452_09345 [Chloroflexota bacterium]|nr:hypothetical protein [Chloroflexota bacterium]